MTGKEIATEESRRYVTAVVAVALMGLSTLQAIAAVASKDGENYPYKVVGATLLAEVFKFVTSAAFLAHELLAEGYCARKTALAVQWTASSVFMAAVPGVAYQLLNNLNFVTLFYVDAPTFQILGNLKIVATGIAGQVMLKRFLTRGKWLALALLTLGAAISQIPSASGGADCEPSHWFKGRFTGYVSAFVCVFLSATMGVFTEMFMKGNRASIHFQNMQLYFFGILVNTAALLYRREIGPMAPTPLLHGFNAWAVVVVVTNGSCGLAVSFMLRYADSIAKTYATALAIPCTAVASALIFGTRIAPPLVLGTGVMVISLAYFYGGDNLFALAKASRRDAIHEDRDDADAGAREPSLPTTATSTK